MRERERESDPRYGRRVILMGRQMVLLLARHLGDQLVELDLAGIQGYLAHKKQPPPRTLQ